jgi:hypothetical protein
VITRKRVVLFPHTDEFCNNVTLLPLGNRQISFTSSPNGAIFLESHTYVMDIDTKEIRRFDVLFDDKPILLSQFIYSHADILGE